MKRIKNTNGGNSFKNPMNINIELNMSSHAARKEEGCNLNHFTKRGSRYNHQRTCKTAQIRNQQATNQDTKRESLRVERKKQETEMLGDQRAESNLDENAKKQSIHILSTNSKTIEAPRNAKDEEKEQIITIHNVVTCDHDRGKKQKKQRQQDTLPFDLSQHKFKSKVLQKSSFTQLQPSFDLRKYKSQLKSNSFKNNAHSQLKDKSKKHKRGISSNTDSLLTVKPNKKIRNQKESESNVRQQYNLKQKLEKFKLDVLKLAQFYEETSLFNSKASELPGEKVYQARDIQTIKLEAELEEKIKEMHKYQKQHEKQQWLQQDKTGSQSCKDASKQQACTNKIIDNYILNFNISQITIKSQEHNISSAKEFNLLESIQPILLEKQSTNHVEPFEKPSQYAQKDSNSIQDFIRYLKIHKQSFTEETLGKLQIYVNDYYRIKKGSQEENCPAIQEQQNDKVIYNKIDEDLSINKQLQLVQRTRSKISVELNLKDEDLEKIDEWQYKYKKQLLKMKKKMWAQYEVIKQMVENRINDSEFESKGKQYLTPKKLMKCFSESYISQKVKEQEKEISDNSSDDILFQMKLGKQPDYFKQAFKTKEYLPTIVQEELSEFDMDQYPNEAPKFQGPDINILVENSKANHIKIEWGSQDQNKMMNATQSQKEDVFQFIFLDLVIQLYEEVTRRQKLDIDNDKVLAASQRVLHSIQKYIEDFKKNKGNLKKRIGFSTNLNTMKAISSKLAEFLTEDNYVDDCPLTIRQKLLKNLNTPIGPSAQQLLRSLRYEIYQDDLTLGQAEQDYEQCQIMDSSLFLQFEYKAINIKELTFERYYESDGKQNERVSFLRNAVHIHHKAIFDCFNQMLDLQRGYNIWGKPFPWKIKAKFEEDKSDFQIENILEKCKIKLLECSKYACGLLIDKEQSLVKELVSQPQVISELSEERICKLLQNYNDQIQSKWYFTDDDEAEILLELSHLLFRELIQQSLDDIQPFLL